MKQLEQSDLGTWRQNQDVASFAPDDAAVEATVVRKLDRNVLMLLLFLCRSRSSS